MIKVFSILPRLIGSSRANEFLLTGNWMNAREALELGFASRMVDKEKMMETAVGLARTMAGKNPLGLGMTKETININIEACLHMENRNQMMLALGMHVKPGGGGGSSPHIQGLEMRAT